MDRQRTCVGCRRVLPSARLIRIVATVDGLSTGSEYPGRGAWLCAKSAACFTAAVRARAF
ncbi:MAG: YlxR family protein, partial [Acidimicrobiales bacterium]